VRQNTPLNDPSAIVAMASAYYGSATLFAALKGDLFTVIAQGATTAEQIARQSKSDLRATRIILDACVALGLLTKTNNIYSNSPAAQLCLVAGSPHDLRQAIGYNRDVYGAWGRADEFLRSGKPAEAPSIHLGGDPERTRRFVMAMHGRALGIGRAVVPMLPLSGCRHLLDLAGGPGTYAVLMAQSNPALHCTVMDLPGIVAVARELVAQSDVAGRVNCVAGDYHDTPYQDQGFDAVTIFGALHQESPEQIVTILKGAHEALSPDGKIFIMDMMTDATHTQPPFSALFAVNMALTTHNGWVFSDAELSGWLLEAGFTGCQVQPMPPPMPHWLMSARKG